MIKKPYKVYLIAGEASGDIIGSRLMQSLAQKAEVKFYGVGGEKMNAIGLNSLFPMADISVMGLFEILPSFFKIISRLKQTIEHILEVKPDIIITIDSPGFNFRIAKEIKEKTNIKLVHYVAPSVWAYKPERATKIAKIYNHLFTLLPFEAPYFTKEGLDTTFVGHPILESEKGKEEVFRIRHSLEDDKKIICISPGSRKSEVKRLLPIFLKSIEIVSKSFPNLVIIIPTFSHLVSLIDTITSEYKIGKYILIDTPEEKKNGIAACEIALTKSGTVTTEIAFNKIPMIVAHKMNPLTFFFLKKMIKINHATLINILADKEIIPEFIQDNCTPDKISSCLIEMLNNNNQAVEQVKEAYEILEMMKADQPASLIAAKKIIELLNNN